MENRNAGEWHVHVDSLDAGEEADRTHNELHEIGFWASDFSGHVDGYQHNEPKRHSTIKLYSKADFDSMWDRTVEILEKTPGRRYAEGEHLALDEEITYLAPAKEFFLPRFEMTQRKLDPKRGEKFRKTEMHLVLDTEKSSQKLITALLNRGFSQAYIDKKAKSVAESDWKALILTAQGYPADVKSLIAYHLSYFTQVGGVVHGSLKKEDAIRHHLFNMEIDDLGPIIDTLTFF